MRTPPLKVGELAKATGLSVRTLHYYDEIGLLSPSHRTRSGHRLYTAADIERLQRIMSLRQLGLRLEEIQGVIEDRGASPLDLIERHLAHVREQIAVQQKLCARLEGIAESLRRGEEVTVDHLLNTIEVMTMFEKYYTPEQLAELKQRADAMGPEGMQKVQDDWKQLFEDVRAEMAKGSDPKSEAVQKLAGRWRALIEAFTGGNPEIARSLSNMYKSEPGAASQFGVDPGIRDYIGKAMG
jgi:DNA-binding transcriptional MerR regulator